MMARRIDPPVAAPEQRIGFLIYRAGLAVAHAYEQRMRPSGFTPGEVGVLTQLASHGRGHIREIGRALGVSPQTVVNLARSLESKGMVLREDSQADRRTVILDVTDLGREALVQADAIARRFDEAMEKLVGEDVSVVNRSLLKLLNDPAIWADAAAGDADPAHRRERSDKLPR